MIEFCQSSEWYHEKCENIDEEVWEKVEINWVCKGCSRRGYIKRKIKEHLYYTAQLVSYSAEKTMHYMYYSDFNYHVSTVF